MPLQPRRGGYYPPATPKNINVNGALQYKFEYDKFGRTTANKVGNGTNWQTLSKMDYNTAGLLAKQTYGNGDYVDFSYDKFDRQTEKKYNGDNSQRVTYSYGNNGSVAQITDYFTNSNTRFTYDLAERVVSQREYSGTAKNGGELLSYTDFTYADKTNYLTGIKHFSPLGTQNIGYTYGNLKRGYMPDQVYGVSWNGTNKLQNYYDGLGRLVRKSFNGIKEFGSVYTYEDITVNNDQRTTTLVHSVETPTGTYTYTYDKLGNITAISDGTYTTSYEYDSLNQLTRVNDQKAGKTYTYSYTNGNITEQNEYEFATGELGESSNAKTWNYDNSTWSDLLTNFNGESITYDEIGNPLTIGSKSLTWTGRQLQSITDDENNISYTYNGDGLRTSKTVNGETTNYYYNGLILAGQKSGDDTLVFMYDNNSDIFGVIYNDVEYYYIKNAQNDVIGIADTRGVVLVKYEYDAWGKINKIISRNGKDITNSEEYEYREKYDPDTGEWKTVRDEFGEPIQFATESSILARNNPILYRSYYYDKETEWYYLKTRYYSPDMCRFINADGYIQTGQSLLDKNMFAYCLNNPVNYKDANGNTPEFFTYISAKGLYYIAILAIFVIVIYAIMASSRNTSIYEEIYDSISYQVRKAKTRRKAKDSDPRIHHMVAKAAPLAAPAREILKGVEINPTKDPLNLITISHGLHKNMHTKKYYKYVNAKLEPCKGDREAVEEALLEIRADIEYAEATGIRRWDLE